MGRDCMLFMKTYLYSSKMYSSSTHASTSNYCLDIVRQYDYENFLCTLLLPKSVRKSGFAIRAFNIEVAKVQEQVKEKQIGQMRMQFWLDTLEKVFAGKAPEHPVASELSKVLEDHKMSMRYFKRLITARINLLSSLTFSSLEQVEAYCEDSVSPIYYLLLQASGIESIKADHVASHLGKAQGLTNLIRSVPHYASQRNVMLPQNVLLSHGVSHEAILRHKTDKPVRDVIFDVAARAKQHLGKARNLKSNLPAEAHTLFLPAVAVDSYLERLRLADFSVYDPCVRNRNNMLGLKLYWKKMLSQY